MNTPEPTYRVPPLTRDELISIRVALKNKLCLYWKWRKDPEWRVRVRDHISALRKARQEEVA